MPFDLQSFEAKLALRMIPTEQLPAVAQEALQAGFDGKHLVRMAILEPVAGWAVDQVLPGMMEDLGCRALDVKEAALRLARERAQRLLHTDEDPLDSLDYFYRLMYMSDYPEELHELGYLADDYFLMNECPVEEQQKVAREALENLLFPDVGASRRAERQAALELEQKKAREDFLKTGASSRLEEFGAGPPVAPDARAMHGAPASVVARWMKSLGVRVRKTIFRAPRD